MLQASNDRLENISAQNTKKLDLISVSIKNIESRVINTQEIVRTGYDGVNQSTRELYALRETEEYRKVFKTQEPLISIRIATRNRSKTLIDKAIKSILKQTYQNFEVIIVGDYCTDDTEQRIKGLGDKRIQFEPTVSHSISWRSH